MSKKNRRDTFKAEIRRQLFGHPTVMGPLALGVLGVAGLIVAPGLIPLGIIVLGVGGSAGVVAYRIAYRKDAISHRILEDLEARVRQQREQSLNELHRKLESDGERRTQQLLMDLRMIEARFQDPSLWANVSDHLRMDLSAGFNRLFENSVGFLQISFDLWNDARHVVTEDVREDIMRQREYVIQEVQDSVVRLSQQLSKVRALQHKERLDVELQEIVDEMESCIDAEKKVIDGELEARRRRQAARPRQVTH